MCKLGRIGVVVTTDIGFDIVSAMRRGAVRIRVSIKWKADMREVNWVMEFVLIFKRSRIFILVKVKGMNNITTRFYAGIYTLQ